MRCIYTLLWVAAVAFKVLAFESGEHPFCHLLDFTILTDDSSGYSKSFAENRPL
jgi:hypothetical protein